MSTFASRQLRLRVLEALEARVKQFLRREELWPLRVPREPLLLDDVLRQSLADDARRFDVATLKSRPLLSLEWEDGSRWEAWVGVLPSGLKIYCDTGEDETRVLASGGRNEGDESDRAFLELFAESAGGHFGIEMAGGAPRSVRSPMDREFLVDRFVDLFEVTGSEDSLRAQLPEQPDDRRNTWRRTGLPVRRRSLAGRRAAAAFAHFFSGILTALQVPSPAPSYSTVPVIRSFSTSPANAPLTVVPSATTVTMNSTWFSFTVPSSADLP